MLPALLALLGEVGGSAAAGLGMRAAASTGARAAGTRAASASKVDKFHALFGEKPNGSKLPDSQNPHLNPDADDDEKKPKGSKDTPFEQFANRFAATLQTVESAARNRFLPLLTSHLPAGFGTLINAVAGVTNAFIERGNELKKYSGQLAMANATVMNRQVMADIREARELGPGISKMTLGADQIWNEAKILLEPIKKTIVDSGGDLLQTCADALQFLSGAGFAQLLKLVAKIAKDNVEIAKYGSPLWLMVENLAEMNRIMNKDKKIDDPIKEFMEMMQMQFVPLGANQPANNPPQIGLNIPLFDN